MSPRYHRLKPAAMRVIMLVRILAQDIEESWTERLAVWRERFLQSSVGHLCKGLD